MKELVKGQKIRIDNHRRGAGGIDYYDDPANDIHLDKTMYDGRKKEGEYRIRVPLNSDRPVTINRDEYQRISNRLVEELQAAFEDDEKRNRFVHELRDVLQAYPIRDMHHQNIDRVLEAMKKISDAFDLGWDEGQIKTYLHKTMTKGETFISLLTHNDYTYYISMNYRTIVAADYSKMPRRYNKEWEELG